jgi:hypothetical protein
MPVRMRTQLATPIAVLAPVIAGGGTAGAAGLAKDSVTSKSTKNDAVKSQDIKDGAHGHRRAARRRVGHSGVHRGLRANAAGANDCFYRGTITRVP